MQTLLMTPSFVGCSRSLLRCLSGFCEFLLGVSMGFYENDVPKGSAMFAFGFLRFYFRLCRKILPACAKNASEQHKQWALSHQAFIGALERRTNI